MLGGGSRGRAHSGQWPRRAHGGKTFKMPTKQSQFVCWSFEPSQPQGIISGPLTKQREFRMQTRYTWEREMEGEGIGREPQREFRIQTRYTWEREMEGEGIGREPQREFTGKTQNKDTDVCTSNGKKQDKNRLI